MFNALLENYPDELVISGRNYPIYTDFTVWLGLNEAMQDITLTQEEKGYIILGVFKETIPEDYESMIVAVMQFLQGNIYYDKRKTKRKINHDMFFLLLMIRIILSADLWNVTVLICYLRPCIGGNLMRF